jgi:hypothetical protein
VFVLISAHVINFPSWGMLGPNPRPVLAPRPWSQVVLADRSIDEIGAVEDSGGIRSKL